MTFSLQTVSHAADGEEHTRRAADLQLFTKETDIHVGKLGIGLVTQQAAKGIARYGLPALIVKGLQDGVLGFRQHQRFTVQHKASLRQTKMRLGRAAWRYRHFGREYERHLLAKMLHVQWARKNMAA